MFTKIKRLFILIFNIVWKKLFFILFYFYFLLSNVHVYCVQLFDYLLTQILRFIDNFTKTLGPIFVITVIVLLCTYIIIAYTIGLYYWYNKSYIVTIIALIIGHWLLINVVWHYYMALTISPGYLPQDRQFFETTSVCKKCIAPKPLRTHHCGVCNRCILKMDHHCPWLNNCIGHFNQRYYYLFCVYTWFGTIFVIIFGFPVLKDHIWPQTHSFTNSSLIENNLQNSNYSTVDNISSLSDSLEYLNILWHKCIIFETITTIGIFVALGCLIMWHSLLITRGETSIERHINNKETLKMAKFGKKYRNPYDFGSRNNWKIFLGFQNNISWFHILLPSNHLPLGDGIEWGKTIFKSHLNETYSA